MLICYPSISVWIVTPIHLFILCLEGIFLSLINRDKKIWKEIYEDCFKEAWLRRYLLRDKRYQIQMAKSISHQSFFSPFSIFPHKIRMMLKYGLPQVAD